jgi:hypothetical protein
VERRVPLLRRPDLHLRALLPAGSPGHPDREPRLHVPRPREPARPAGRDHRLHGQPRSLRAQRQPAPLPLQLDHPGRLRDPRPRPRGLRRRRHPQQGRRRQREQRRSGAHHHPGRGGAVRDAVPGARHHQDGAALPLLRLHRPLHRDGHPRPPPRALGQPPERHDVVALDDRRRAHRLHRRARLDRERCRLLPVPAQGHEQGQGLLVGQPGCRHPLRPPRAARGVRLHGDRPRRVGKASWSASHQRSRRTRTGSSGPS